MGSVLERGWTRSVMIYIDESDSTASMNLSTSGCRVVRSFLRAFCAKDLKLRRDGSLKSYSKTETSEPSSWVVLERQGTREGAHSFCGIVEDIETFKGSDSVAEGEGEGES